MTVVDPVRQFFYDIGDGEWDRFDKDARSRVSLEVHRRFLRRHVPERSYVLEIGAGPGRFTIELAEMGCRVVVSDVSPVQLEANARRVAEAGLEGAVVERRLLDVRDLTALPDAGFDAVVAYGGPLSYVFEDAEPSLAGMLRVVRPGGRVVASVMSLIGTLRMFVALIPAYAEKGRLDELKRPSRAARWVSVSPAKQAERMSSRIEHDDDAVLLWLVVCYLRASRHGFVEHPPTQTSASQPRGAGCNVLDPRGQSQHRARARPPRRG